VEQHGDDGSIQVTKLGLYRNPVRDASARRLSVDNQSQRPCVADAFCVDPSSRELRTQFTATPKTRFDESQQKPSLVSPQRPRRIHPQQTVIHDFYLTT
jgi:hypothetical protein